MEKTKHLGFKRLEHKVEREYENHSAKHQKILRRVMREHGFKSEKEAIR